MNGFYDTKWKCLHIISAFVCHAENGYGTHSLHLHLRFYPHKAKGDIDAQANAYVTCKQSLKGLKTLMKEIGVVLTLR